MLRREITVHVNFQFENLFFSINSLQQIKNSGVKQNVVPPGQSTGPVLGNLFIYFWIDDIFDNG